MKNQGLRLKQSFAKFYDPIAALLSLVRSFWFSLLGSRLLVIGLFVLALLPRLLWLDAQSLWLDEGSTWQMIQQPWSSLLQDLFRVTAAYPLYHLLLKAWVTLAGDSEWALRFPSALAGAGAVVGLYGAATEIFSLPLKHEREKIRDARPLVAALLLVAAPFALWYAQDAKTYSLLLLVTTLLLWSLLRALRLGSRRAWGLCVAVALTSIFVHRLALLLLVAAAASLLLLWRGRVVQRAGAWLLLLLASGGMIGALVRGLGSEKAETGAYIPATPLQALWLTFVRFSVDRWPGEVSWWWLLPSVVLTVWGSAALLWDLVRLPARQVRASRIVLLCFLLIPPGLFLTQLAFTRLYEARYLLLVFPAWLLLLAYPVFGEDADAPWRILPSFDRLLPWCAGLLMIGIMGVNVAVLTQPKLGLFSGDPVKEQYREALQELAVRVHPDDLVIMHPEYLRPLYNYYMRRLTVDPVPTPVVFDTFKQGQREFNQKDWDAQRRQHFAGYFRSFLLIAPEHARTVDQPLSQDDEYGLVGLYFRYSHEQQKWPCGIWRFNGAHLFCQDSPEAYETGAIPQPATPLSVGFGEHLELLGYSLKATTPAGTGVYQAGGTLPITLFWDVKNQPTEDYAMFLHLCQDCNIPPVASQNGPPLEGYLPTSTWLPDNLVHDERAIPLPQDLPPGRYTLLLGVFRPGDPTPAARLPVQGTHVLADNRLVLGTVEIGAPE